MARRDCCVNSEVRESQSLSDRPLFSLARPGEGLGRPSEDAGQVTNMYFDQRQERSPELDAGIRSPTGPASGGQRDYALEGPSSAWRIQALKDRDRLGMTVARVGGASRHGQQTIARKENKKWDTRCRHGFHSKRYPRRNLNEFNPRILPMPTISFQ